MIVQAIKTEPIIYLQSLTELIDIYIPKQQNRSILAITSKIISIAEGRIVPIGSVPKDTLVIDEAEWYIPRSSSKYDVMLTINQSMMIAASGIDESNANGNYVLWPTNSYQSAEIVWNHIRKRDAIQDVGVIVTDSRNTPARWGAIGVGLSYCGFEPIKNYIGTPDIFGRKLVMTKASLLDGIAAAAVVVMGEGSELTPFAQITELPDIIFQDRPPTLEEIEALKIDKEDDLYAPFFNTPLWKKGNHKEKE
jgi:putative folate metabolism gamma-glutamate ligase